MISDLIKKTEDKKSPVKKTPEFSEKVVAPKRCRGSEDSAYIKITDLDVFSTEIFNRKVEIRTNEKEARGTYGPVSGETFTADVRTLPANKKGKKKICGLLPYYEDDTRLNAKQREWKKQIVSSDDLREKSPDVVVTKKRLGLYRYILYNELVTNRNGLLYYLIPLLLNIVFLFFNITNVSFIPNAILAVSTAALFVLILYIRKLPATGLFLRFISVVIFVGIYIGAWYLLKLYVPDFWARIYIPFMIKLLLIILCIYHFGKFYAVFAVTYAQDVATAESSGNVVIVKAGKPRVGKTSQAVQDAFVLALKRWNQLQYDYWNWHSRENEIFARNDTDELLLYNEIKISYEYYINNPDQIPCLWSNIKITDKQGRKSSDVMIDHIRGVSRLPLYSVVLFDEIGAVLRSELSLQKKDHLDVSDMFRLGGQFLKWTVICCEQDYNNIYIDCRRVVGVNSLIVSQDWVSRPHIIYGLYSILKFIIGDMLDGKIKRKPKLAKFMNAFGKFVYSIGFRRQAFQIARNTQTDATVISKGEKEESEKIKYGGLNFRYIPSTVIVGYDDRYFRKAYPSFYDKDIKGNERGKMSEYEYVLNFVSDTDKLKEKREAVESEINKIA